jgi:hypothetical protein
VGGVGLLNATAVELLLVLLVLLSLVLPMLLVLLCCCASATAAAAMARLVGELDLRTAAPTTTAVQAGLNALPGFRSSAGECRETRDHTAPPVIVVSALQHAID